MELRILLLNAERIQSHVLHIFFLAAPDVMTLAESHREAVGIALRLRRMANQVAGITAGGTSTRYGRGVGAVEVPRGTLYHEDDIGEDGRIRHANCIIPAGQNLAHIEKSMRERVPMIVRRMALVAHCLRSYL